MARHQAIAATSAALLGLLRDRYPRDEFGASLDVQLYQSRDFESPMREGFSVFLYRVSINGTVRNMTLRRAPDGRRFRPSLPLDLHYLITPWAEDGALQHRMLGCPQAAGETVSRYVEAGADDVNVALRAPWSERDLDAYLELLPELRAHSE